ncbi:hypothetical protein VNI00_009821 [Paramarasmius palmivorus]|uniref:Kinocilin n=1 Tax=Paramarasmius palmivorus TaxID=297713 RepID=A0AAW0CKB9_9AGAR
MSTTSDQSFQRVQVLAVIGVMFSVVATLSGVKHVSPVAIVFGIVGTLVSASVAVFPRLANFDLFSLCYRRQEPNNEDMELSGDEEARIPPLNGNNLNLSQRPLNAPPQIENQVAPAPGPNRSSAGRAAGPGGNAFETINRGNFSTTNNDVIIPSERPNATGNFQPRRRNIHPTATFITETHGNHPTQHGA